jgi:hypothetical protein
MVKFGGPVDRSLRRRGQLLVVVGALLGALIGVALGLAVEDAATSRAAAPGGGGAGRQPARQPALSTPGRLVLGGEPLATIPPGPGRHPARAIRQAAWQRPQGRQRRPGQARQGQPRQARTSRAPTTASGQPRLCVPRRPPPSQPDPPLSRLPHLDRPGGLASRPTGSSPSGGTSPLGGCWAWGRKPWLALSFVDRFQ